MRHVFVCTTDYAHHWARTIAKKKAQAEAMTEAERQRIRDAVPEEHADGHTGAHCGQRLGGPLYERFKAGLARREIRDVLLSPNACIAQHVAGCMVMVYPDGVWYAVDSLDAVDRIIDEHLVGGRPVESLIHRRVKEPEGRGLQCVLADRAAGTP